MPNTQQITNPFILRTMPIKSIAERLNQFDNSFYNDCVVFTNGIYDSVLGSLPKPSIVDPSYQGALLAVKLIALIK